mgnify:FL=1
MKKFLKGMHKDVERVDMPEGTFRDALNANLYFTKASIVNEQGNSLVGGYAYPNFTIDNIIGQCTLEDGRIVIFAIDSCPSDDGAHIIALANPKLNTYQVLYRNNALNFQKDYTIEAEAKVDSKGQIKVYFTDNYIKRLVDTSTGIDYIDDYNPPRVFDVTRQLEYINTFNNVSPADQTRLYGEDVYNVDKLDLFLHSGDIPEFTTVDIVEGGGVNVGTYHLALAYMDDDRNTTNYLVTSNAVHIVTGHEDVLPTESIGGDPQGAQSNKSVTWKFTIPTNRNYTHIQPVVIQRSGGGINQTSSEFAYALDPIRITDSVTQSITYTGLETVAQASVSEVVIDSVRYETAKTIVQLDNRLYISNLQSRGDLGYQRFANAITLNAITEEVERFDPRHFDVLNINKGYSNLVSPITSTFFNLTNTTKNIYAPIQGNDHEDLSDEQKDKFSGSTRKGYKDVNLSYKKKSYRRSEVYAFYISFVLKDGTETYAYHIPGRQVKEIGSTGYFENEAIEDHTPSDFQTNVGLHTGEFEDLYKNSKLHQITDTQVILKEVGGENVSTSFWENDDEVYPTSDDFEIFETNANGVAISTGEDIKGKKVRHHKMPSNKHKDYSFVPGIETWDTANSNANNQFEPNLYGPTEDNTNQNLELKENIRLLGVKLSNIHIPKFILKQVQGYKVYYAKRRQRDKTIIGQSIPTPSAFEGNVVTSMRSSNAKFGPYHRAFLMYGGIPPGISAYPLITSVLDTFDGKYRGFPVFKFHDFHLLKNRHSLSGASHIDVQKILTFRTYGGGPGGKERPTTNIFAGTQWGPNTEIGNNLYPNFDTEDDGNLTDFTGIKAWVTSIFIASSYNEPNTLNYSPQFQNTSGIEQVNVLNNIQTLYTIQPKGRTYLPGHTIFENTEVGAFHGAKYLLNFAGESCAAFSLSSGLPMLLGYYGNAPSRYSTNGNRFWWYPKGGYLNIGTGNTNYTLDNGTGNQYIANGDTIGGFSSPYPVEANNSGSGGFPTAYLINLCSIKENVYDSFDEQQLVWTGYYEKLSGVDIETGNLNSKNYYTGAESSVILGGDTYITRYGFRTTSLTYGAHYYKGEGTQNDIPFNLNNGFTGDTQVWNYPVGDSNDLLLETNNLDDATSAKWSIGNNTPIATIFYFFCESEDLIGYRHSADTEAGVSEDEGRYFDGSTANSILFNSPINDGTKIENMLYMNNYSLNQDIRVTIPLPKKLDDITSFPNRTIRSSVDEGVISDRYRNYLALEFKDVPKNRGDIWDIFTLGSILYIHTEKSLFVTKGKENLQIGSATQAFIGSGNIFAQDPDELIPTKEGYGGTDAQFSSITTRFGHFYVNRKARKVFMYSSQIEELSALGMEKWFNDNIPYRLEDFGIDLDQDSLTAVDAPTNLFGFTAAYDPKYKRIILTKRERVPTQIFIDLFNNGGIIEVNNSFFIAGSLFKPLSFEDNAYFKDGGWTLSYYPETKIWGSRHSYIPRLYAYNTSEYFSLVNSTDVSIGQIWEHSNEDNPGNFFGTIHNFEFEFIDNTLPGASKIFSTVQYWTEVQANNENNATGQVTKHMSPGFTSFYVYNTKQISGTPAKINYLSNIRLVDKFWYINDFRDKAIITTLTNNDLVTGVANVQENFTTGVDAATQALTMFTDEGIVNTSYIDPNKQWYDQRRFVDHYLGIRLICNNSEKNLVHLFAAGTKHRKSFR